MTPDERAIVEAEVTLLAVYNLHEGVALGEDGAAVCAECRDADGGASAWPCRTVRLLDGESL